MKMTYLISEKHTQQLISVISCSHTIDIRQKTLGTCSCRSVTRCWETVPLGHYDCSNAKDAHNSEVDKSRLRGTVEGVVQPWHKGAHDEKCNAWVVKPDDKKPHRHTRGVKICPEKLRFFLSFFFSFLFLFLKHARALLIPCIHTDKKNIFRFWILSF